MTADRPNFPWWEEIRGVQEQPIRLAATRLSTAFDNTFRNPDAVASDPDDEESPKVLGMGLSILAEKMEFPENMRQFLDFLDITPETYSSYIIRVLKTPTRYSLDVIQTKRNNDPLPAYTGDAYFEFIPENPIGSKFEIVGSSEEVEDSLNTELMTGARLRLVWEMVGIVDAGFDLGIKNSSPEELAFDLKEGTNTDRSSL